MKTFIDTNILYQSYPNKKPDFGTDKYHITSVNALEFLRNIEKEHNNRAKYYIPQVRSETHFLEILRMREYFKKRNHPINKRISDSIIFDFKNDFSSYTFYNNESILAVINNNYKEAFYMAIEYLEKKEYKDVRSKFNFLLELNVICEGIAKEDIILAYDLLDKFLLEHNVKNDFRNSWNDILILSRVVNQGAKLISSDKLLNRFAAEVYLASINRKNSILEIQFPSIDTSNVKRSKKESKGYINRGWDYKIRKN